MSNFSSIRLSKEKIYINIPSRNVMYFDLTQNHWVGISESEGVSILCNAAQKNNFADAINEVKSRGVIRADESDSQYGFDFLLTDLRERKFDSNSLKDLILSVTKGQYIDKKVREEISNRRPSLLKPYMHTLSYEQYSDFFFVVANKAINPDRNTRYCIISTKGDKDISSKFNDNIPVYKVKQKDFLGEVSILSRWFRETLGFGFCVTDIDFLLRNGDKILVIEEKVGTEHNESVGQNLSRNEFINDALKHSYIKDYLIVKITDNLINLQFIKSGKVKTVGTVSEVVLEVVDFLGGKKDDA